MTANIGSTRDKGFIGRIEVPNVASLHKKHGDPIDAGDDGVEGEWCSQALVLAPNCVASVVMFAIVWSMECVVNPYDHNKEPGDNCQHLVRDKGFSAEVFAPSERII